MLYYRYYKILLSMVPQHYSHCKFWHGLTWVWGHLLMKRRSLLCKCKVTVGDEAVFRKQVDIPVCKHSVNRLSSIWSTYWCINSVCLWSTILRPHLPSTYSLSEYQFIWNRISPLRQCISWNGINHSKDFNNTSLLGNKTILFHSGRGYYDPYVKRRHPVLMRVITGKSKST